MGMQGQLMLSSNTKPGTTLDPDRWLVSKDQNIYETGRLVQGRWHVTSVFDDGVPAERKVTVTIRDRHSGTIVHATDSGYDAAFALAKSQAGMP